MDVLEARLMAGSKKLNLAKFMLYVRAWQTDNVGINLWQFYSQRSVRRKAWDTRISMDSAINKATDTILNMIKGPPPQRFPSDHHAITADDKRTRRKRRRRRRREWNKEQWESERPVLLGFGADALTTGDHRRGSRPALDAKLATRLLIRAKSKKGRRFVPVRIDEYGTSKFCPRCAMFGRATELRLLRQPPPLRHALNMDQLNDLGEVKVIRIKVCPQCQQEGHGVFHRDGALGHCQSTIAKAMLEHGQTARSVHSPIAQDPKQLDRLRQDGRVYTRGLLVTWSHSPALCKAFMEMYNDACC
ncbi:hypothetical protein BDB00DRAFT_210565 [Zychaea mexicana]|uniref:uncharacterized protein n=1 Tax=Zychaea mexicana TaxID=64656 RepID=UPI0022FF39DB|nr:uncharacterized protein BDB00DRAFT_210565 [Zychaea mexicana]KAI9495688.1 hypothetical protein BDB00DRAFT_210565 [Zychaea mexicana]